MPRGLVLASVSRAFDLAEGEPLGHAMRSCAIGMAVAHALDLPAHESSDLFVALLLKDAGCSANAAAVARWFDADDRRAKHALKVVDWSRPAEAIRCALRQARPGRPAPARLAQWVRLGRRGTGLSRELTALRCSHGAELVQTLGWAELAPAALLGLDEHWDGSGQPLGLAGDAVPILAQICLLAQTAEVFRDRSGAAAAETVRRRRRGTWFAPALVETALGVLQGAGFWNAVDGLRRPADLVPMDPDPRLVGCAGVGELSHLAAVFAVVVDAKSPWTKQHSSRVGTIARGLAGRLGLAEERRSGCSSPDSSTTSASWG